jgi:hypothetical protein
MKALIRAPTICLIRLPFLMHFTQGRRMFDSAQAFTRYRLEVVRTWPDGELKDKLLAAIESSLRQGKKNREHRQTATNSSTFRDSVPHDARVGYLDQD